MTAGSKSHAEPLNIDEITGKLSKNTDFVLQDMRKEGHQIRLIYLKAIADESFIMNYIYTPFYEYDRFTEYLLSLPYVKRHQSNKETLEKIAKGFVVIIDGESVWLADLKQIKNGQLGEATVESVIQGPRNSLSENLEVNMNLVRSRYIRSSLVIEGMTVGKVSQTPAALVYDEDFVEADILKNIKEALAKLDKDIIQTTSQLHNHMNRKRMSLFPTMLTTERPDRIAFNLTQGKVVILMEGTGFSLIVPSVFYDFMSSMEDMYQSFWISRFFVGIRYIGLLLSTTLASIYVGVTSYNPDVLRVQLSLSIAGSRATVPYPAYVEVLFMLIMMEMLTEASVRLPKSIGSTATTVGGLILGQAATQAGLVSNIMIILVAAVAISNFVIPINTMSFGMRVIKYVLLIITTLSGLMGMIVGLILLIGYLANQDSFGKPYLKLFMEQDKPVKPRKRAGGAV